MTVDIVELSFVLCPCNCVSLYPGSAPGWISNSVFYHDQYSFLPTLKLYLTVIIIASVENLMENLDLVAIIVSIIALLFSILGLLLHL